MIEMPHIARALRVEQLTRRLAIVSAADSAKVEKSPNAEYAAQVFLRAGQFQSVGNDMQTDVETTMDRLEKELIEAIKSGARSTTKLVLQSGTRLIIDSFANLKNDLTAKMGKLVDIIHERNLKHLAEHHGAKPTKDANLSGIVANTPIMGTTLSEQLDKVASDTIFRFKSVVRSGIAAGDNTDQLVQRLTGKGKNFSVKSRSINLSLRIIHAADPASLADQSAASAAQKRLQVQIRMMDSTELSVNKVIQAAITAFANATDGESADSVEAEDKKMGWQWLAVQDANVCEQCEFYDGSKWDEEGEPIDEGPEDPGDPPLHPNCRCSKVPIDLDAKEVPQDMDFDDYLSQFSRTQQEAAFGKLALRQYQRGDITPAQMMGQKENMMTLEGFKHAA